MKFPEQYRKQVNFPGLGETEPGTNGCFDIPYKPNTMKTSRMMVIATNGEGWNHCSVSMVGINKNRCPTWEEMCFVKDLFWDAEATVVQYHPPRSEYVSNHPYCLHMWEKQGYVFPLPDSILVGFK